MLMLFLGFTVFKNYLAYHRDRGFFMEFCVVVSCRKGDFTLSLSFKNSFVQNSVWMIPASGFQQVFLPFLIKA